MKTAVARSAALLAAALLVLAGCGDEPTGSSSSGSKSSGGSEESGGTSSLSTTVRSCEADAPEVTSAKTVAPVDLDADGTAEPVKLTAPGGHCGNTLFADLGDGYVAAPLPGDEPPVTSGYAIQPSGGDGQLLVTRADHPRGGYQLRLYGVDGAALTEVTDHGKPLVPFVATDVQEHPFSIDCGDGGFVLTEAVTHQPVGIAAAWDIQQTTYTLQGTDLTAGPAKEVADNVLPQDLKPKYPELVSHAAFTSCKVNG